MATVRCTLLANSLNRTRTASYNMATKRQSGNKRTMKVMSIPRVPNGPPQNMTMRLRYVEDLVVTCTSGVTAQNTFRINDLYDINWSGAGHQSYLRDQMYLIYKSGRVLDATFKVTFISASPTVNIPVHICIAATHSSTVFSDIQTAAESPGAKSAYLNANSSKTLVCRSTADDYFGYKKGTIISDSAYAQGISSSLTSPCSMFYAYFMKTLDATTASVYVKVEVDQITRFEDPLQQSSS